MTRPSRFFKLTPAEAIQADCDVKAIIMHWTYTPRESRSNFGKQMIVICYYCKGEDTCPNIALNLNKNEGQATQTIIIHNAGYQSDDSDAYDSDYDELNTTKGFQNPFYLKKAQKLEPKLYDGNVIKNTCAIVNPDSKETLILAEEIRLKMLIKQQDPMDVEKKVNTTPVDYDISMNSLDPSTSKRPTKVEAPKERPKVSMAVEQHCLESKTFETKMNQVLNENERLLEQVINMDIVNIVVNSSVDNASAKEKDLVIIALNDELRKLKGKALVDNVVTPHTIASEMLKIDVGPIAPRLLNNKTDSGFSKHMTKDSSQLTNFVNKFLGTVKFRKDHTTKIMGYCDYLIGNVTILRVYYVEGLGHNLFFV
nr:integrase, catalytic region, zinc finger, CCHC-type, peptidase aspartic, catalytic [Tanacetum cinerariifolium]